MTTRASRRNASRFKLIALSLRGAAWQVAIGALGGAGGNLLTGVGRHLVVVLVGQRLCRPPSAPRILRAVGRCRCT